MSRERVSAGLARGQAEGTTLGSSEDLRIYRSGGTSKALRKGDNARTIRRISIKAALGPRRFPGGAGPRGRGRSGERIRRLNVRAAAALRSRALPQHHLRSSDHLVMAQAMTDPAAR
jgi:hypothetical protein